MYDTSARHIHVCVPAHVDVSARGCNPQEKRSTSVEDREDAEHRSPPVEKVSPQLKAYAIALLEDQYGNVSNELKRGASDVKGALAVGVLDRILSGAWHL